ncbi:fasciclin-1-like [Saccostrea echinata]|uniref:fasciclin-1-like n=1 Tax=Saccostrea echinata TaxID=191078 RepID=UPI002A81E44C|nr:fasciclin-1-like [Saccostrea echinata]
MCSRKFCCPRHLGLLVCLLLVGNVTTSSDVTRSKTIRQLISEINRLRGADDIILKNDLGSQYEQPDITAFVPSSEIFWRFKNVQSKYGLDLDNRESVTTLMLYHIGRGKVLSNEIVDGQTIISKHPSNYNLRLNIYHSGGEKIFTVNGAELMVRDIVGSNGVLYIIDRILAPVSSAKTLHDYLLYPDLPGYQFQSIARASIIDPDMKAKTNHIEHQFTSFVPPDAVLFPMPSYAQDILFFNTTLLKYTIHAHIVEDEIVFIPARGELKDLQSKRGTLHFIREGENVYVQNNRIRARVVMSNIPVANGVVHVIDHILYFIYKTVFIRTNTTQSLSIFASHLHGIPGDLLSHIQSTSETYTFFAPNNEAFAKIPRTFQQRLGQDDRLRSEVLGAHIVKGLDLSSSAFTEGKTFKTINNFTLTIRKFNGDLYVQNENILAKIVQADIGCTNGVIHIVSSVLRLNQFTVLDAIKGNNQLLRISEMLRDFTVLEGILSGDTSLGGKVTVFMPSDLTIMSLRNDTRKNIFVNQPDKALKALKGHIIEGEALSSTEIYSTVLKYTFGGQRVEITNTDHEFTVEGSYVVAKVVTQDIWCSNGVLHIIDNILHIPTRNIMDELARHEDVSSISNILRLEGMKELSHALSNEDNHFTMFVPINTAFSAIPRSRADTLFANSTLFQNVLKAHVTSAGSKYTSDLYDGISMKAEEEFLHITRVSTDVFITNNNVRTRIIRPDIPAINGIIHVVDTIMYYPFYVAAEVMYNYPKLRIFYDLMKNLSDFSNLLKDEYSRMTVFAPSSKYLSSLSSNDLQRMASNPQVLRKIFKGHVIPNGLLDSKFIRKHMQHKFTFRSSYGIPFTFEKQSTVEGTSIDAGFSNLRYDLDINRDGVACSNGVIYVIDGFLDYSFKNIIDEMKAQDKLKASLQNIMGIFPPGVEEDFRDTNNEFTVFMPASEAFLYLSQPEISYLYNLVNTSEKYELLERHTVNGTALSIERIRATCSNKNSTDCVLKVNVIFKEEETQEILLEWNGVQSKIIQSNILANNGIIHIIDRILFKVEEESTLPTNTMNTRGVNGASRNFSVLVSYFSFLTTLCFFYLWTR